MVVVRSATMDGCSPIRLWWLWSEKVAVRGERNWRRKKKGGSFYQNILTLRIELPKMPLCSICVKHFMSK
jgi:hypothetical protein